MAALVAQLKQQLLPELEAMVARQQALPAEAEQSRLAEAMQATQQAIVQQTVQQAQQQIGRSIESIEDVFRQAMATLGQQQVESLQQAVQTWVEMQQAQLLQQQQQLQEEAVTALATYTRLLQDESRQKIAAEQALIEDNFHQQHRMALEHAFAEFAASQTAEFKHQFAIDASAAESHLQDTVHRLVTQQMAEIEAMLNTQLRSAILEVLRGVQVSFPDA